MSAIITSVVVSSESRGTWKKNVYRYTLDTGEVHERRGWIPSSTLDVDDMAMRGALLLSEVAQAEADALLGGG